MMDLPEGTVISDKDLENLTELEKKFKAGKLKPETLPQAIREQVGSDSYVSKDALERIKSSTPNIAPSKTLGDLSPEEQARVMAVLSNIKNKVAADPSPSTDEAPAPVPDVNTPKDAAKETSKDSDAATICPNCLWNFAHQPSEVTDEDKANWLRAILGRGLFTKTYKLLGDKFNVTFRARVTEELDDIQQQLRKEMADGRIPMQSSSVGILSYNDRLKKLSLACSLVNATGISGDLPAVLSDKAKELYRYTESDTMLRCAQAYKAIFSKWSDAQFNVVFKQFLIFEELCYKLTEAAASPNFWETPGNSG